MGQGCILRSPGSCRFVLSLLSGGAIAALSAPGGLHAQTPTPSGSTEINEIVVTARKTSEALQTTPVAVTALDAESLREAQITMLSDLQTKVPSLSTSTGGPGGPLTVFAGIRGQVSTGGNSVADTAVATYVDGVYFARQTSGNLGLFDLAQAEVLRGPQGTLFGRNTTGGALNLVTVQPGGTFEGYGRIEYGNFDAVLLDGAVTVPLSGDELSVRVAGRYASHDGYYRNVTTGKGANNLEHFWGLRGTMKWAPASAPITLTLSGDYSDYRDDGQAYAIIAVNTALAADRLPFLVGPGGGGKYEETYVGYNPTSSYPAARRGEDRGVSGGVSATLDVDLGAVSVRSITAWRKADADNTIDVDGSPFVVHASAISYRQDQFSEELQVNASTGPVDLIAGLMYFHEDGTEQSVSRSGGSPSGLTGDIGLFSATSKSIFAQANYNFTDRLRGTIGYRHTWDKRDLERRGRLDFANPTSCGAGIPLTPTGCSLPLSASFDFPAWLIGADYRISEQLFVYAKASRAFLSGGFNLRFAPPDRESFEPEERIEYEVGAKLDLFDRRLRTNIAAFTGTTTNAQRSASGLRPDGTPTGFIQNTGDVKSSGVELDLTAIPWRGMELTAGAAYLHARYKRGSFVETRAGGVIVDRSGELVPMAPEWKVSFGATQSIETGIGTVIAHADYTFVDDQGVILSTVTPGSSPSEVAINDIVNRAGMLDSYSILSGRLALQLDNGLELAVWGRNLTGQKYYTNVFPGLYTAPGFGVATKYQGMPRTYGVNVAYRF